jgi:hypothetical protein
VKKTKDAAALEPRYLCRCGNVGSDALGQARIGMRPPRNAATKFYVAGIRIRSIAETTAWDEESAEKIIRRYVNSIASSKALIEQNNDAGTKTVKL